MEENSIDKIMDKLNSENIFISGIYNYCDRWCERCSYTDRCLNYATAEEFMETEDGKEPTLEDTIEMLSNMFNAIINFLQREAEKRGIDLREEVDTSEEEKAREKAYTHPLAARSYEYFQFVHNWFQSRDELLTGKAHEFIKFAQLGLDEEKIEKNVYDFKDALEVIQWYFTLIRVKLLRALDTKFYDSLDDPEFNAEQYNTSAKIALIGCTRSREAWKTLYDFLVDDQDKILDILAYLDRLIKDINKEFPDLATFKRPYFD